MAKSDVEGIHEAGCAGLDVIFEYHFGSCVHHLILICGIFVADPYIHQRGHVLIQLNAKLASLNRTLLGIAGQNEPILGLVHNHARLFVGKKAVDEVGGHAREEPVLNVHVCRALVVIVGLEIHIADHSNAVLGEELANVFGGILLTNVGNVEGIDTYLGKVLHGERDRPGCLMVDWLGVLGRVVVVVLVGVGVVVLGGGISVVVLVVSGSVVVLVVRGVGEHSLKR